MDTGGLDQGFSREKGRMVGFRMYFGGQSYESCWEMGYRR